MKTRACVLGYPAKHSRSPKLHGYWLEKYQIDGTYGFEEIAPEEIEAFLTDFAASGYVGANVTMPHKDIALELSEPDARALAVGAANTLWLDGDQLRSTNTDVEGFQASLDAGAPGWEKTTNSAIVLGAGGAARAVIYGLIERGIKEVHVVNRTLSKADALRARFGDAVKPASWNDLPTLLSGAALLVNGTSLGMKGEKDPIIDLSKMADKAIVADIVYVPLKTKLLKDAERLGFVTANGLDMLLHQAVGGFERWFGHRPEVTKTQYDLIASDIGN